MSPQPLAAPETATLDAVASFLAECGLGRAAEVVREDSCSQGSGGRGCGPSTGTPHRGVEEPALAASLRRLAESLGVGAERERPGKENLGPQGCVDEEEPWLDSMLEKVVAWTAQAATADEAESRLLSDALQAAGLEEAASAAVQSCPRSSAKPLPPPPLPAPPSEAYRADRPGAPLPDGSKDEYRDDGDPGYRVLHLSELDLLAELREKYRATLATVVARDAVCAPELAGPPLQRQDGVMPEPPSAGLAATAAAALGLGTMAESHEQAECDAASSGTLPLEELTAAMAAEREATIYPNMEQCQVDCCFEVQLQQEEEEEQQQEQQQQEELQQQQQELQQQQEEQQQQQAQEQQEQLRLQQQQQHMQLQLQQQQLQLQQQQLQQQFAQQQASLLQSSAVWTAPRALASSKSRTAHRRPGYRYAPSGDPFYPACYDNVTFDSFPLRIVYERDRTGFEESKEFPIQINSVIAARYQVISYLGQAAFSRAVQCLDLHSGEMVCMKIIKNDKDFIDQSLDEIKLLKIINANTDSVDDKHCLRLIDYIYHKEHLIIITELLRDNLYEFSKYDRERGEDPYFTLGHLQRITRQLLVALQYVHSLWLIHADLKPENVLVKSYSRCEVKLIDFGSSCFVDDRLSSYVQSRSYRAPEVILGLPYDQKVDIWSLGCVLAELWTGYVLFQNDSVQSLLARVEGIIGKIPVHMMSAGRFVPQYFAQDGRLFREVPVPQTEAELPPEQQPRIQLLLPKRSSLRQRLRTDDEVFVDFLGYLLRIDPTTRPTATEALQHPWLSPGRYSDGL